MDIKLKYYENKSTDLTAPDAAKQYQGEGHARAVCFILDDGRKTALYYSYMVSADHLPEEDTIVLSFTTHTITLAGLNMEALYFDFLQHLPKVIMCDDARYNKLAADKKPVVNTITIKDMAKEKDGS